MPHQDVCQAPDCDQPAALILQGVALCQAHTAEIGRRAKEVNLNTRNTSGARLLRLLAPNTDAASELCQG